MKYTLGRWVAIFILAVTVLFNLGSHINVELHSQSEIVSNNKIVSLKIQEQKVFGNKLTFTLLNTNRNKPKLLSQWEEVGLFSINSRMWYLPRVYQSNYVSVSSARLTIYPEDREETIIRGIGEVFQS